MRVENPESLIDVLVSATIHANSIMTRKHIIPSDTVRAGQFLTSLRSEMGMYKGSDRADLSKWLTTKGRWSDILLMQHCGGVYYGSSFDINDINHAIEAATNRINEYDPQNMAVNIDRLSRKVDTSQTFITRARQLSKDATEVGKEHQDLSNKIREDLVA